MHLLLLLGQLEMMNRRHLLRSSVGLAAAGIWPGLPHTPARAATPKVRQRGERIRFGLVTYMWGADWDVPTLLANCAKAGADGVELRTGHAHGVEPRLNAAEREAVKRRFADSPVKLVGLGCNEDFHDIDAASLKKSIELAKQYLKLSHDVGGSGVKVKPNDLPSGVPREKTIEQIGLSLNELAAYAADLNQEVRLEVHGGCARLPIIASIMEIADHPSAVVCWNSNPQDLEGQGLEHNFKLVQKRLGATTHVRQLDGDAYPNSKLVKLLKGIDYDGWLLIEASDSPPDRVAALAQQRGAFDQLMKR
jgi:sugar phosphate isomerase/epimerase